MSNNLPSLLIVDAMVGATAYTPLHHEALDPALSAAAMDHVRRAQVDIYCSHNHEAISAIREARDAVLATPAVSVGDTLVALDEAAWYTRHNDFVHAEEALEVALDRMKAMKGPARRLL